VRYVALLALTACAAEPKPAPAPARDAWHEENPPVADDVVDTPPAPPASASMGTPRYGVIRTTGSPYPGKEAWREPPSIALGEPVVTGIEVSRVAETLMTRTDELLACYRNGLALGSLEGEEMVSFSIDSRGRSTNLRATGLARPRLDRCVIGVIARLSFPVPWSGVASVRYPLVFTAGHR
jgi:outer membrane biosynthesis protein TonB